MKKETMATISSNQSWRFNRLVKEAKQFQIKSRKVDKKYGKKQISIDQS